jgi:hypothetical protein
MWRHSEKELHGPAILAGATQAILVSPEFSRDAKKDV